MEKERNTSPTLSDRELTKDELRKIFRYFKDNLECNAYIHYKYQYISLWFNGTKATGDKVTVRYFQNKIKITDMFFGYGHKMEELKFKKQCMAEFMKPFVIEINKIMGFI